MIIMLMKITPVMIAKQYNACLRACLKSCLKAFLKSCLEPRVKSAVKSCLTGLFKIH